MSQKPFFSVVVPLYNKERYIAKTLASIINQSFKNFEIIVIDDGSKDKSCEIVESIKDNRLYLIQQENGGPSKARNRGIKEANGQYIAFLDADDLWMPEKLQEHYVFAVENPDIVWSCTGYRAEGGKRVEQIIYDKKGVLDDALDAIIDGIPINSSTAVIKKSVFNDTRLLFNESVKRSEDREVWLKIACLFPKIGNIKSVLTIYRVNAEGSLSASSLKELDFPFLSLQNRIEDVLSSIDIVRKKKVLSYLKYYNVQRVLSLWGWTDSFRQCKKFFEGYVDDSLLSVLEYWDFLPLVIKKVAVKIYLLLQKN